MSPQHPRDLPSPDAATAPLTTRRGVLRAGAGGALAVSLGGALSSWAASARAATPTGSSIAALAASTGCATLTPEETQGPFWVDERLNRSDIRPSTGLGATRTGVPLTLTIRLQDAGASCAPQVGAIVDVWHADAQGTYSDVSGQGNPDNRGQNWLRGYQVSDGDGAVTFTTIYPGWYVGRTIHIHFRVRTSLDAAAVNFTSQIFFDESVTQQVVATAAYQKSGTRTTNSTDSIYDAALVAPVTGSVASGYAATFTANLDFGDGAGGSGSTTGGTSGDTTVTAGVVSATVVRRGRRRVLKVRLDRTEEVTARLRLSRGDDVLASKRFGWLAPGASTLTLRVPRTVATGRARAVLVLADRSGNAKVVRRLVQVPRR